jgi:hypothetical protein
LRPQGVIFTCMSAISFTSSGRVLKRFREAASLPEAPFIRVGAGFPVKARTDTPA